jgi:hypothetical protein
MTRLNPPHNITRRALRQPLLCQIVMKILWLVPSSCAAGVMMVFEWT